MTLADAHLPGQAIDAFCRRWRIRELAIFGSALREEWTSDSDLDFLVTYEPDAGWNLLDHIRMEQEPAAIIGQGGDLLTQPFSTTSATATPPPAPSSTSIILATPVGMSGP